MMSRTGQDPVYRVVCWLLAVVLKLTCGAKAHGAAHVPQEGSCIIAANHASFLDPPALAVTIPHRQIRFMARDSLFRSRLANWVFSSSGVIPLSRERGDIAAMRTVLRALKHGQIVCLFPEGTRTFDGELQAPRDGIGFLIAKAAVDVVPVYIDGTYGALPRGEKRIRRHRLNTFVGEPIRAEELASYGKNKVGYAKIASVVMERIAALKPAS